MPASPAVALRWGTGAAAYVAEIALHATLLQGLGYLLQEDADAIILQATLSSIGN